MRFKELTEGFFIDLKQRKRSDHTIEEHKRMMECVLLAVGNVKLSNLRLSDAALVMEAGSSKGKTGPHKAIVTFRCILRYAAWKGYRVPFYWKDIEVPQFESQEIEALEPDELKEVRSLIPSNTIAGVRTRAMFEIMLRGGLRISEALSLNISDINRKDESVVIQGAKNGQYEKIYITGALPWIDQYLKLRKDENPALFIGERGNRFTTVGAKSYLRLLRSKITFKKHLHWHICRKTFATYLVRHTDIKSAQILARHKSERTTLKYYAAVSKERCKQAHREIIGRI